MMNKKLSLKGKKTKSGEGEIAGLRHVFLLPKYFKGNIQLIESRIIPPWTTAPRQSPPLDPDPNPNLTLIQLAQT